MHNITYRTLAAGVVIAIVLTLLFVTSVVARPQPPWWTYAEKMSFKAWLLSLDCRCERAFAVDLVDGGVKIRWFVNEDPDQYASQVRATSDTVAVFHTHLHNSIPSSRDREVEKKLGIPVYVIHGTAIVESRP